MDWTKLRVGYVAYSPTLTAPGDRRRFPYYARKRGIEFEIADSAKKYDVVVASEKADLSVWSRYPSGKIVFDFIDSYLAVPRRPRHLMRGIAKFATRQSRGLQINHWMALRSMCRRSAAVVCSTAEQRELILPHCENVHMILDFHDPIIGTPKDDYRASRPFRLVWEGLPENVRTLREIGAVLRDVHQETPLSLHLVTDARYSRWMRRFVNGDTLAFARKLVPLPIVELHPWSQNQLASVVRESDLAVIPIPLDDPLFRGKPENKLLIFWRLGLPALVSATPAHSRAMRECGLDMACPDAKTWADRLRALVRDESLRREAGQRGRRFANDRHSEAKILAAWDAVFASLDF